MKSFVAIKQLDWLDLSIFKTHYIRRNVATNPMVLGFKIPEKIIQIALSGNDINLAKSDKKVPFGVRICWANTTIPHTVSRCIFWDGESWRLGGELIPSNPDEADIYNLLDCGDYAIIKFIGAPVQNIIQIYLVARALPQDAALYSALEAEYGSVFSPRRGMEAISPERLARLLNSLHLPEGHPALDFIDLGSLEDAAQGGFEGLRKLRKQRQARGVSHEEFDSAKQAAEKVGKLGEELLNSWLESQKVAGNIEDFRWESRINAIAPYDFVLLKSNADARRLDAKSTSGDFRNPVHISMAELLEMSEGGLPYDLYRLYLVNQTSARLRIVKNLRETALAIVEGFKHLPSGVSVDGISLSPNILEFGDEIIIAALSSDEDNGT